MRKVTFFPGQSIIKMTWNTQIKLKKSIRYKKGFVKSKLKEEFEEISFLKEQENVIIDWQKIYHAVIFPTYKEGADTLRASILACEQSLWPKEKMNMKKTRKLFRPNIKQIKVFFFYHYNHFTLND